MVDARVLRLHLGLLSAKAYLVCALTGLREGRGEPYRQCQSKLCEEYICSAPTNRPNVSLFYFYISVSLLPAWPQLASFPDRGMVCRLLLLLAGLLLRVLTDRGPKLILINRYSASLQGHACYPPINKDVPKMGKNKAPVLASTVTTRLGCLR